MKTYTRDNKTYILKQGVILLILNRKELEKRKKKKIITIVE